MFNLQIILSNLVAAVILVSVKGFTKALVSSRLGDPIPRRDRRVTLNPLAHVEPIGLLLLVFTGFGWEKPVETSRIHYKNRKQDTLVTSLAPLLAVLLVSVIAFNVLFSVPLHLYVALLLHSVAFMGATWVFWQLLPIYPMEGQKIFTQFLSANRVMSLANMEKTLLILLILILFMFPGNMVTGLPSLLGENLLRLLRFV